ncbi:MAG: aspartate 1-decarboxylase [Brevinematia bacterium]
MLVSILKSKIHRAAVTETNIDYVGSITIDVSLMEAADIHSYEQVHVWNITNGSRLMTYAIPGERGSGVICLNGAAAHLNQKGDKVIIAAFALIDENELKNFTPKIVLLDSNNRIEKLLFEKK